VQVYIFWALDWPSSVCGWQVMAKNKNPKFCQNSKYEIFHQNLGILCRTATSTWGARYVKLAIYVKHSVYEHDRAQSGTTPSDMSILLHEAKPVLGLFAFI